MLLYSIFSGLMILLSAWIIAELIVMIVLIQMKHKAIAEE